MNSDSEWWMGYTPELGEEIILSHDIEHMGQVFKAGSKHRIATEPEDAVHDCGVNGILALVRLGESVIVLCEGDFTPTSRKTK